MVSDLRSGRLLVIGVRSAPRPTDAMLPRGVLETLSGVVGSVRREMEEEAPLLGFVMGSTW
jgi:hypothetical protein